MCATWVTGGFELNKFDLGDGDITILGLKMSKKCKKKLSLTNAGLPFMVIFSSLPRNEH
jgi:hypothetical protein